MQTGSWRTGANGTFKVFIRGCEQQVGTRVEVYARFKEPTYAITTSTHSKISGGYLYNYYRIRKPEPVSIPYTSSINVDALPTRTIGEVVSAEELDAAIGLD
jgi:hypothetical protein